MRAADGGSDGDGGFQVDFPFSIFFGSPFKMWLPFLHIPPSLPAAAQEVEVLNQFPHSIPPPMMLKDLI